MKTLNTFFTLLMFVCFSTMMYGQGDDCASAQTITLTAGATTTLTGDGPSTGAGCFNCGSATNADWFTFTAPATGTVDIAVCNDPDDPDTRLWVYDGGCGALNQVAADDDGCTGTYESQVLGLTVCAGTTYHLEFDDRWGTNDYDFEVTLNPLLACTNGPANLNLKSVGLDSITVDWDGYACPSLNAGMSMVEYGPAGFALGTGTTMMTSDDSATISGLMSNTAYDIYVIDTCMGLGSAPAVGPLTQTTLNPCADPTNVNTDVVTTNSATISYVSSLSTPTGFAQIEYSTAPFAAGSGPTALLVSNDTFTLTGLSEVTTYYYYVREVCSVSPPTYSNWQGPFSFTTPFSGVAFYDFETATPGNANGIFYNGWSAPTSGLSPDWEVENSNGANENSTQTGPFFDNTSYGTIGGHYMYLETSGGTVGNVDSMTSPMIDLTGYPNPYLNFYLHMYGSSMGTLEVQISDNLGASWSTIFSISGQQTAAGGDPWTPITIDISAYTGNIQVRFVGEKGAPAPGTTQNYRGDMSIDDVSVGAPITTPYTIPTCPDKPTSLAAFNITSSSADVSFALGNSANTDFEVEYGPAGFALGTGTIVGGTGFPPVNLTNLMPGTAYDAYARDICDPITNDASPWSDPVSFTTLVVCNAITTFPYIEDFDALTPLNTFPPFGCITFDNFVTSCWDNDINNSNNWIPENNSTSSGYIGSDHTTGSGNYAYLEAGGCGNTTSSLISPELDFSAGLNGDTSVIFWYYREPDNFNANDGSFEVYASMDNGATWSTSPIFSIPQDQGTDQWEKASFSIGAYDGMSSVRLRFDGQTGNSRDVAIDDIEIGVAPPSCAEPTDLGALAGLTTAQLFWTSGGSFLHNVVITPAGSGIGFPLLVLRGVTDEFVDVQQPIFMPNTSYDFYVQDSCLLDGIASPYAGPFTFTTINPACNVVAPYTEDFDAATLNSCWIQDPSDDEDWTIDAGGTGSPGTGPAGDTTTPAGTGNYIYYETSAPVAPGDEALLITPNIDVSALTTPELEFFYHMWDDGTGQMGDLEVYIESPATSGNWSLGLTISGNQGNQWNVANLDLIPYLADTTVRAAFLGIRGPGFRGDISLDEVSFQDGTACPVASNVFIDNITTTSATVSWIGSGASYNVEYGVEGFTPGTGTMIMGVTTGTAALTGLMTDVEYEVYITNDCGAGVSATTDPTAFHSDCGGKPGDSFMDPIMVMSLPYADTNRTDRCYTNTIANANGYAAPEVVYEVTTGSMLCQTLTASMCGSLSNYDGYIYIYDVDGVELATGDDDCGIGGGPGEIVDFPVEANSTYYVVVSGWQASQGSYELSITSAMRTISANTTGVDATTIGGADGMAIVAGADGVAPYTYIWETGATTDTVMGLMAGTYTVIVTDALGCTTSGNAVVGEPCPADLGLSVNTFPSDTAYGSIVVTANQGAAPYTYSWSSGDSTSLVTVPGQVTYNVTVTDANGCMDSTTAQLLGVTTNQIESVVEYNLFPNPAVNQTQLQIGFGAATDVTLEVVTVDGKVLFNELRTNVSNTTFDIDTENYAAGVYMVKVTADNQTMTRRLVVMKP